MKDPGTYVCEVDKHLARLRERCLGQDTSLKSLLPEDAEHWTTNEQAAYLRDLMLFAFAKVDPSVASIPMELVESSRWLYDLLRYLLGRVASKDHTFAAMRKILQLDERTRACMFCEQEFQFLQEDPPFLLGAFDLAVLYLLENRNLLLEGGEYFRKIVQIKFGT